jgi:hypothetical protein
MIPENARNWPSSPIFLGKMPGKAEIKPCFARQRLLHNRLMGKLFTYYFRRQFLFSYASFP